MDAIIGLVRQWWPVLFIAVAVIAAGLLAWAWKEVTLVVEVERAVRQEREACAAAVDGIRVRHSDHGPNAWQQGATWMQGRASQVIRARCRDLTVTVNSAPHGGVSFAQRGLPPSSVDTWSRN